MKKKLLALALMLLIPLSVAYAATTHYGYVTPTVGGSQNTWGTLLNTIFGSIDANIWSASGGTTIALSSTSTGANFTMTNPVSNVNSIAMTTTGKHVGLPPMNATASPVPGGIITFINSGSNAYQITANDGTTNVIAALGAGQVATVQALTNSTTNGTWQASGPYITSIGTLSLGSAAATSSPSISGDSTTGFYTAGAATVDVSISGTKRAEWTATGEAVTGTISSSSALLFTATGAASAGQTGVHSTTANALSLMTTGTDRLVVANDGGIVIGAATGGSKGAATVNVAGAGYYVNGTLQGSGTIVAPQGRLSLTTGVPVMNANTISGATSVFYVPYVGNSVPIYNGSTFTTFTLASQLTLALDSNSGHTGYQQAGKIFDLFIYSSSGTPTLATGPAWTNATTRSSAITQTNGIWTNTATITLKFDTTTSTTSVSANQATYVGTMYANVNGQTAFMMRPNGAAGGSLNILGLWNAYNRVHVSSLENDSNATWSSNINGWQAADNNSSNSITFVDGLQQSPVQCITNRTSTGSVGWASACYIDSTTSASYDALISSTINVEATAFDSFNPQLGLHVIYALENTFGSGVTFVGGPPYALRVDLDM